MCSADSNDTRRGWNMNMESSNAVLIRNWWAIAIRGLAGIAVGATAFVMPGATMLALVLHAAAARGAT
jgi:uncharacterized membrane protein HdeD (DUF308 family)